MLHESLVRKFTQLRKMSATGEDRGNEGEAIRRALEQVTSNRVTNKTIEKNWKVSTVLMDDLLQSHECLLDTIKHI